MTNPANRGAKRPTFRVHLVDEATVVPHGERVRVWFLPFRDTWIRAKDHPEAEIDEASSAERSPSCPPGTIWERTIDLQLEANTHLLSRVTNPLIEHLDTIDYLTRDKRGMRRHVSETWFVVTGNYKLNRASEPAQYSEAKAFYEAQNRKADITPPMLQRHKNKIS